MTSMMISRITKLLHSLRSVLEKKQKTNSIIKITVLEKISTDNVALSDAEESNSGPLNKGGIAGLLYLRKLFEIHQIP